MSDLVRFGVAMERTLLSAFDRRIAARGYENRSEALRDLVRADLTRAAWERGATVAATITLVYDHRVRDLSARLAEIGDEHATVVVGSLRVPLAPGRSLDVMAVRGRAAELTILSGRIAGIKGVLSCELTLAAALGQTHEGEGHAPALATEEP